MPSFGIADSVSGENTGVSLCYCGADRTDDFRVRVFEKIESREIAVHLLYFTATWENGSHYSIYGGTLRSISRNTAYSMYSESWTM
jgi:hypothetical protein